MRLITILKTFKELQDEESLCEYCFADPGWHSTGGGDPYCCEGAYCENAYDYYLDSMETTANVILFASKVKLLNKEIVNG